jgi:transposase InsO family protein
MIEEAKEEHPGMPLSKLCDLFGVSRSWYYEKPSSDEKASEDVELRDAIERIVLEFSGYGYRRVTQTLKRQGWRINRKKVLRVMRKEALLCQLKRRFKPTTDSSHSLKSFPNLIKDAAVDAPNQAWSADITYIRLPTSFCYLASIIDEYSRYCVGWALSRWIDTRLTLCALRMALESRSPAVGLIHHSDRGVHYASGEYVARLEQIARADRSTDQHGRRGQPLRERQSRELLPDTEDGGGVSE